MTAKRKRLYGIINQIQFLFQNEKRKNNQSSIKKRSSMKNKIFNLFKDLFVEQIKAFALSNFPLQHTTQVTNIRHEIYVVKIKKGNIKETRIYDDKNAKQLKRVEITPYAGTNCITQIVYEKN